VFFCFVPGLELWFSNARFTTGPLTRNGSVGSRPADGPASTLLAGNCTVNESEYTPDATTAVRNANGVFW
jgi:hypothetical protein